MRGVQEETHEAIVRLDMQIERAESLLKRIPGSKDYECYENVVCDREEVCTKLTYDRYESCDAIFLCDYLTDDYQGNWDREEGDWEGAPCRDPIRLIDLPVAERAKHAMLIPELIRSALSIRDKMGGKFGDVARSIGEQLEKSQRDPPSTFIG